MKLIRITTVPMSLKFLLRGQMRFMKEQGIEVVMVSSDGAEREDVIRYEGCRHEIVPMTRVLSPFRDLSALWKLWRLFRKEKPDIVHTHTPKAGLLGMMAAKLAGVKKRYHTVAGLPVMEAKGILRFILMMTEKMTISCATGVYPNSIGLKNWMDANFKIPSDKLHVLGNGSSNGIDTYFFSESLIKASKQEFLRKWGIGHDSFVFCFVGRFVGDKGIHELIGAFLRLKEKHHHIKLLMAGSFEDEKDAVKDSIKQEMKNNPDIILTGFLDDVRPVYAVSQVCVFPSYREGFPNVPMQAGSMGLPVIATDINGCNEIIENEVNGLLIPKKDEDALYNAMEKLLKDEVLFNKLKSNARTMIEERFDQQKVWECILKEYQN